MKAKKHEVPEALLTSLLAGPSVKGLNFFDVTEQTLLRTIAISELGDDWIDEELTVPVVHTLLPANRAVSAIISERLN